MKQNLIRTLTSALLVALTLSACGGGGGGGKSPNSGNNFGGGNPGGNSDPVISQFGTTRFGDADASFSIDSTLTWGSSTFQ